VSYVALIDSAFEGHSIFPGKTPEFTKSATQPISVTAPSRFQSNAPVHQTFFRSATLDKPV